MAVEVTTAKKTSVYFWVKSLYTAITDLWKTCALADVDYLKSCVLQKFHSSAGCDDLPTELYQLTGEFYHACLI